MPKWRRKQISVGEGIIWLARKVYFLSFLENTFMGFDFREENWWPSRALPFVTIYTIFTRVGRDQESLKRTRLNVGWRIKHSTKIVTCVVLRHILDFFFKLHPKYIMPPKSGWNSVKDLIVFFFFIFPRQSSCYSQHRHRQYSPSPPPPVSRRTKPCSFLLPGRRDGSN